MSVIQTTKCDGCGVQQGEDKGWVGTTQYTPYKTAHYCPKCWVERAPASERVRELEQQHKDDVAALQEQIAKAARAEKRADELNDLLAAARLTITEVTSKYERTRREVGRDFDEMKRLREAEVYLKERLKQLDAQYAEEAAAAHKFDELHRALVREVLGMLGKKARKRHSARIAKIELALTLKAGADADADAEPTALAYTPNWDDPDLCGDA